MAKILNIDVDDKGVTTVSLSAVSKCVLRKCAVIVEALKPYSEHAKESQEPLAALIGEYAIDPEETDVEAAKELVAK